MPARELGAQVGRFIGLVRLGDGGKARLQAWGILENATGEDWQDVDVTLSSGSPVTLKQRLLESYWRDRPEIPVFAGAQAPREAQETNIGLAIRQT